MLMGRLIYRLIRLIFHLLVGIWFAGWYQWGLKSNNRHVRYQKKKQWWLKKVVEIIGLKVYVHGQLETAPVMLVANHVSWLDIPLLGGVVNPCFLSKESIKHWPIIGWLATLSGTLYIKRGNTAASLAARESLIKGLKEGKRVLIFPEGTTSSGRPVKSFYPRLYAAAIETQAKIQPIAIIYKEKDGSLSRDFPYINEQRLLSNLLHIISKQKATVDIYLLPAITTEGRSRRQLANESLNAINAILKTIN